MGYAPGGHTARRLSGDGDDSAGSPGIDRGTRKSPRPPAARVADAEVHDRRVIAALEQRAADFLARFGRRRRHHVVCAMLLTDGREVVGLNLVSNIGVASVCAEQIAIGEAMKLHAEAEVSTVITLRATFAGPRSYEIVPPCGRCREVLFEYAPSARIALSGDTGAAYDLVSIDALLPHPFRRRTRDWRHDRRETLWESGS